MAKPADAELRGNYSKLVDLFWKTVPEDRFKAVGCGIDVGMMGFVVLRRTTYAYSSYAIGYNAVEVRSPSSGRCRNGKRRIAPFAEKSEIQKASYIRMPGK
jgi:hypothetical protein